MFRRQLLWGVPVAGAVGLGLGVDRWLAAAPEVAAKQELKPATTLPVTRVVMFSSGVGYFSRSGEVEGDARVDLWCAEGLRSVKLAVILQLRISNAGLEAEFRRALEVLAASHDTQKKAVSLHFAGDGKRKVQVGYVLEAPIWKTSYRLVLDAE